MHPHRTTINVQDSANSTVWINKDRHNGTLILGADEDDPTIFPLTTHSNLVDAQRYYVWTSVSARTPWSALIWSTVSFWVPKACSQIPHLYLDQHNINKWLGNNRHIERSILWEITGFDMQTNSDEVCKYLTSVVVAGEVCRFNPCFTMRWRWSIDSLVNAAEQFGCGHCRSVTEGNDAEMSIAAVDSTLSKAMLVSSRSNVNSCNVTYTKYSNKGILLNRSLEMS